MGPLTSQQSPEINFHHRGGDSANTALDHSMFTFGQHCSENFGSSNKHWWNHSRSQLFKPMKTQSAITQGQTTVALCGKTETGIIQITHTHTHGATHACTHLVRSLGHWSGYPRPCLSLLWPDLNTSLVLWRNVIGSWWFTAVYTGTASNKISGSRGIITLQPAAAFIRTQVYFNHRVLTVLTISRQINYSALTWGGRNGKILLSVATAAQSSVYWCEKKVIFCLQLQKANIYYL